MKKWLFLTLLLVMLLLCSTALACPRKDYKCDGIGYFISGDDYTLQHTCKCNKCNFTFDENHYNNEGKKPALANCVSPAVCGGCGKLYGKPDPNNHQPETDTAVAPTCTQTGLTEGSHCTREGCGKTIVEQQVVKALGHTFENYTSNNNATCTQDSTETGKCSRCDETDTRAMANTALGHAPVVDSAVDPTCTQPGLTEGSHCERCPEILTEQQVVPVLGHAPVGDPAVAPTCTRTGLTWGSHCGRCSATLTAQRVVASLGHDAVIDPAVEPLCEQPGLTEGTHCGRCDAILLAQERVSCRGHWYAEWTPDGDDTHGAGCLREGCRFAGTAACTQLEAGDITFCPICGGASDGTRLARVEGAKVAADRIPPGELMVRQRDGLLAICFVRSGKLSRPYVPATVILPNGDSHVIAFAQDEAPVLVVR